MKAGFYKRILTEKGEFYMPKSISFSKMDQIEFESFYDKMINQVIDYLGCDKEDLINEISKF